MIRSGQYVINNGRDYIIVSFEYFNGKWMDIKIMNGKAKKAAISQHKKQKFEKDLRQTGSTSKKIYLHGRKNGYTWPYAEKYTYNVIWLKL